MDLGSVLVGLGTLFIFMAPVLWLVQSEKNKKKKKVDAFKGYATSLGLEIADVAFWSSSYCLAVDTTGKTVLYGDTRLTEKPYTKISLAAKRACKLVVDSRKLKREREVTEVIDRISLTFVDRDPRVIPESLIIFNADSDPSLSDQMELAQVWVKHINSAI